MREPNKKAKELDAGTPGSILRNARESAGLSVDQVAGRLYLLRSVVKNLEADNYERIRGDTFVRGYMRNYARLLGVPVAPLLARYDRCSKGKVPPDLLKDGRGSRLGRGAGRLGSLALMLGIGALPMVGKRDLSTESAYPESAAAHVESTQHGSSESRS